MKIFVNLNSGEQIQLEVDPEDTIEYLKSLISDMKGICPKEQRLIFHGHQLEDDNTLIDYSIKTNDILNLLIRLCGGKPVIYLYPPTPSKIKVSIELKGNMTCLYPKPKAIQSNDKNTEKYEWEVEANQNSEIKYQTSSDIRQPKSDFNNINNGGNI